MRLDRYGHSQSDSASGRLRRLAKDDFDLPPCHRLLCSSVGLQTRRMKHGSRILCGLLGLLAAGVLVLRPSWLVSWTADTGGSRGSSAAGGTRCAVDPAEHAAVRARLRAAEEERWEASAQLAMLQQVRRNDVSEAAALARASDRAAAPPRIPRVLHQMWKQDLVPAELVRYQDSWRRYNPVH